MEEKFNKKSFIDDILTVILIRVWYSTVNHDKVRQLNEEVKRWDLELNAAHQVINNSGSF